MPQRPESSPSARYRLRTAVPNAVSSSADAFFETDSTYQISHYFLIKDHYAYTFFITFFIWNLTVYDSKIQ